MQGDDTMTKYSTTKVVNLATLEERTYVDTLPCEAVIYAWLNEHGQRNTQEYRKLYLKHYRKLTWGKRTVAMEDWCASTVNKQ